MSKLNKFALAVFAQVVLVLIVAIMGLIIATTGTLVRLSAKIHDVSRISGAVHATLNITDLTEIPTAYFTDRLPVVGDIVFVELGQTGNFWYVSGVSFSKTSAQSTTIKGRVVDIKPFDQSYDLMDNESYSNQQRGGAVVVEYEGLDTHYVEYPTLAETGAMEIV